MIYRAVFHLDMDDSKPFGLALTNVTNLLRAIPEQHHDLILLFNGPAVALLKPQASAAYLDEILHLQQARVSFKVCRNALKHFQIDPEELIEGCDIVPAGVVSLIELQHDGYAYIKP